MCILDGGGLYLDFSFLACGLSPLSHGLALILIGCPHACSHAHIHIASIFDWTTMHGHIPCFHAHVA